MTSLQQHAYPPDAQFLQRFFKTAPGQYGAGDIFLGVRVPVTRRVCKPYLALPPDQVDKLLESPFHEHRLAAVIIMASQAQRAVKNQDTATAKQLYQQYCRQRRRINNWDIVDVSCPQVVGGYLYHFTSKQWQPLSSLAASEWLWDRRIAIISTLYFIRQGWLEPTWDIATTLLQDSHDLIQKAVGWMLREAGKHNQAALLDFLEQHAVVMPRTMLRYSIEKLSPSQRKFYLARKQSLANSGIKK